MIIIKTFNLNFFKFLRVFAGAVKGKTNAITCNSIKEGSVDLEGSAAPSADPGSAEAADQLQALNDVIKSGEIAGMSVAESQLVVEEGSVGSSTSKDNVVGIVLGICIPIGVLRNFFSLIQSSSVSLFSLCTRKEEDARLMNTKSQKDRTTDWTTPLKTASKGYDNSEMIHMHKVRLFIFF